MTIKSSHILLPHMRFYAYHGVIPQEQIVGAFFIVSLEIEVCFENALKTDDLTGTISYADVYHAVKEEMEIHSHLLEHVAGRIVNRIFRDFPSVFQIKIELFKENPPIMGSECPLAGVQLVATNESEERKEIEYQPIN